jgi:uncharacterized protein (TIGR03435 family)
MSFRNKLLLFVAVASACRGPVRAQPVTKSLSFEAASVRPSKSIQSYGVRFTPDGISAKGVPLKFIIRSAYSQFRDPLWSGEPPWLASESYDIEAKFNPADFKDLTDDQRHIMLQNLLAERFKLVVHRETREIPEYALVVTKGGAKLRVADAEKYMRDDSNHLYCRAGLTNFRQCTMAEFAADASIVGIDRIVVDKTGLTGRYDFELIYSRQTTQASTAPDAAPDIFTALQEQLGLKLEPIKGPLETIVVDRVERPSEN